MIDKDGFRLNVGIVLSNSEGRVFWGKRMHQDSWQFPQGGIDEGEDLESALFRELWEEVGLKEQEVSILGQTRHWLRYTIPRRFIRDTKPMCIGQKQKWFLLKLIVDDQAICLNRTQKKQEFSDWLWVSYWYPLRKIISFKRSVYRRALRELAPGLSKKSLRDKQAKPLNYILDGIKP